MKPGLEEMRAAAQAVSDCPFARMVTDQLIPEVEHLRETLRRIAARTVSEGSPSDGLAWVYTRATEALGDE